MTTPVVVVGGGPAGLMLAGELRLAGSDVIVLERLSSPSGESRGIGFTIRTMEIFDQRGILHRLGTYETATAGHFGGVPLDMSLLGAAHEAARTVPQSTTERALEGWATDLGADIRRGHTVTGFTESASGVSVDVETPAGPAVIDCEYLVGCDGGRSTVRKNAGFDFPGTDPTTEMLLADIRGVDLEPRMIGEHVGNGFVMVARLADGIHRVIVGEHGIPPRKRTAAPHFSEVSDLWKRLTGSDISHGEPLWVSAFADGTRQVTEYRRGRVLLAGDAAHVHLPAGGQGMNTSVQDTFNLGWKLGRVTQGLAQPDLLDTYQTERHEVGRRMLINTQAQSKLVLGGEQAQPLRDVLSELIGYPDVARHLGAMVSGLDICYDVGGGTSPLLGRRLPHLDLTLARSQAPATTTSLLRKGRGLLLVLEPNAHLERRAQPWAGRIDMIRADLDDTSSVNGATAILVRPDGYVAWVGPGSNRDLRSALTRWFGRIAEPTR